MRVGVYGLGRFGYVWAKLLAEYRPLKSAPSNGAGHREPQELEVWAYNRSPQAPVPPHVRHVSLEELATCDALFLCTAISALKPVLQSLLPHLSSSNAITILDTCSVKCYPAEMMTQMLPSYTQLIGTHPMFGPDSFSETHSTMHKLPIVYCPIRALPETIDFWRDCFTNMNLDVIEMSSKEHDKEAANTQGITHFIGRLLSHLSLTDSAIGTLGYRRLLQVIDQTCKDPYQLFVDLQQYNQYSTEMRTRLRAAFEKIIKDIPKR